MQEMEALTDAGTAKWVEEEVYKTAHALGFSLDCQPEWDPEDRDELNRKLAVTCGGRRLILRIWKAHIEDIQGRNKQAVRETKEKLAEQIRKALLDLLPLKGKIGFR
jgi:hypothetical protein